MTGRNNPCPCGSGKKYKKCCLSEKETHVPKHPVKTKAKKRVQIPNQMVFFDPTAPFEGKEIEDKDFVFPKLPTPNSYKSYSIYRLSQLIEQYRKHIPNDELIQAICYEITQVFMPSLEGNTNDKLKEVCQKIATISGDFQEVIIDEAILNEIEQYLVAKFIARGNLFDYIKGSVDYGASKAFCIFIIQFLECDQAQFGNFNTAEVYTDTADEVVDWKLSYNPKLPSLEPIDTKLIPTDPLDHEYTLLKRKFPGLSNSSLRSLATAFSEERTTVKSKHLISYNGKSMSYFGVIEAELRRIINKIDPLITKKMMWLDIIRFIKNNSSKFKYLLHFAPDIAEELEELRDIRNRVAHGETILEEEFNQIRFLLFGMHRLKYISWEAAGKINKDEDVSPMYLAMKRQKEFLLGQPTLETELSHQEIQIIDNILLSNGRI